MKGKVHEVYNWCVSLKENVGVCISCCVALLSFPPQPQVLAHNSKSCF